MLATTQKKYSMILGSNMDIPVTELDFIAAQLEIVINSNFPHIRVHISEEGVVNEDETVPSQ